MGQFSVRARIAHPTAPDQAAEVDLLVDTGATLSWVPRSIIEQLNVPRVARRAFLVADGRPVDRETAGVLMRVNGSHAILTVVIAEPRDGHLLGATALESLGFTVDPIRQQLIPRALLAM